MTGQPLLSVRDLAVEFGHGAATSRPVDGVDLAAFLRDLVRILSAADARIGP